MASKELNDHIDSYIGSLRTKKVHSPIYQEPQKKATGLSSEEKKILQKSGDEVYVIQKDKTFVQRVKEVFTGNREIEEDFEIHDKETGQQNEQEFQMEYKEMSKEEKSSTGFFGGMTKKKAVPSEYAEFDEEEILLEGKKKPQSEFFGKEIDHQPQKVGRLERFFRFLAGSSVEEEPVEMPHEIVEQPQEDHSAELAMMKQDMKEVALVTTKILKRLSKKQLEEFRKSPEFSSYKSILLKYKVAKEKGTHENA